MVLEPTLRQLFMQIDFAKR